MTYFTIRTMGDRAMGIMRRDNGLFGSAEEAENAIKLAPLEVPPYTIRELTADEVNRLYPEDVAAAAMAKPASPVRFRLRRHGGS